MTGAKESSQPSITTKSPPTKFMAKEKNDICYLTWMCQNHLPEKFNNNEKVENMYQNKEKENTYV